jgi:predicted nucleic acid-binding protein
MSLVLDASVVIKWFINEPLHEVARQLLTDREVLHAPDLLIPEVGNIAWKKMIRGEIEEKHAHSIVGSLPDLPVMLHPSLELVDRGMQIASAIKHPVYDCLYLACAEAVGGRLVTADERLKRALADTPLATICRNLSDPYDIAISAATIEKIIELLNWAKATWASIEGNDVSLHLDTPVFVRVRNEIHELSDSQRTDLLALSLLGGGSGGRDWQLLRRNAKDGLSPDTPNDLIYLVGQSAYIERGWRELQKLIKTESKKK